MEGKFMLSLTGVLLAIAVGMAAYAWWRGDREKLRPHLSACGWLGGLFLVMLFIVSPTVFGVNQVMAGLWIATLVSGVVGAHLWNQNDVKNAPGTVALFVFFLGVSCGLQADKAYKERREAGIAALADRLGRPTGEAKDNKYEDLTTELHLFGGLAACCALFLVNYHACVIARGPQPSS